MHNSHKIRYRAVKEVMIMASNLRLSKMIPTIPKKMAGNEIVISNHPRAAIGLPQPGRSIITAKNVVTNMAKKIADIFPKRILAASKKPVS